MFYLLKMLPKKSGTQEPKYSELARCQTLNNEGVRVKIGQSQAKESLSVKEMPWHTIALPREAGNLQNYPKGGRHLFCSVRNGVFINARPSEENLIKHLEIQLQKFNQIRYEICFTNFHKHNYYNLMNLP